MTQVTQLRLPGHGASGHLGAGSGHWLSCALQEVPPLVPWSLGMRQPPATHPCRAGCCMGSSQSQGATAPAVCVALERIAATDFQRVPSLIHTRYQPVI